MTEDGGTNGPVAKRTSIRPWRRRQGAREPDPLSLRGREDRVVRWIGAARRRRKAAVPETPPERGSNVIVLADVEILRLERRPRLPAAPARRPDRAPVATLLPFVRRVNVPVVRPSV